MDRGKMVEEEVEQRAELNLRTMMTKVEQTQRSYLTAKLLRG